jgi:hypothetical protein
MATFHVNPQCFIYNSCFLVVLQSEIPAETQFKLIRKIGTEWFDNYPLVFVAALENEEHEIEKVTCYMYLSDLSSYPLEWQESVCIAFLQAHNACVCSIYKYNSDANNDN